MLEASEFKQTAHLSALAFVKLFIYLCQYTCISCLLALQRAVPNGVFPVTSRLETGFDKMLVYESI